MSKITGKETNPEIVVRKYLFAHGFRFRKNVKDLPGTPDIVLPKHNIIIFVHGCFWHGHSGCSKASLPSSNKIFWKNKISKTVERDSKIKEELEKLGWNVFILWQCSLNSKMKRDDTFKDLIHNITKNNKKT